MATLYDIQGRALELMSMADDEDIDIEVYNDTLEAIEGEYDDKIETYCKVIKNLEGEMKAVADEVKRLQGKKKHLESNIERMKKTVFESLKAMNKKSAGGTVLKASIRKSGGVLPIVLDVDEESIPFEFQKVKIEANNEAIRDALDNGVNLEFAHFGERGESLNIR